MSEFKGPALWGGTGKRSVQARTSQAPPAETASSSEVDATDAAKALAAEHGISLSDVTGTGADGRITKDDVAQHVTEPEPEVPEVALDEPLELIPDEADTPAEAG